MATVIDSLLIELGLDTSKFDAAQKKSVDQLRKFDEQAGKSSKNAQRGAKDMGEGFEKARDALISFGVAAFGSVGFANFVNTMTTTNAALGRNATLFSMSARELDAWGSVLKTVGGDAEAFQSSIQNLQSGVAQIKLGNAAMMTPLARLGALNSIDVNKGTVDIYKLADALSAFRKENGEQLTFTLAQQLGINKETYMVLSQGSATVRGLYDQYYKLSGVTEQNTAAAQKFQGEIGLLSQAMSGAKNQIMDQLYPAMGSLAEGTTTAITKFTEWDKQLHGGLSNVLIFDAALITLMTSLKALGISFATQIATVAAWAGSLEAALPILGKVAGAAVLLFHSGELNKGEDEELKAMWEKYDKEHGTNYAARYNKGASGGAGAGGAGGDKSLPRNLRNNNPGNIEYGKFAIDHGATGSDGRFAIFPDMKAGEKAMADLLALYAKGGANTIDSIIRKWSPASENGAANTTAYIADVSTKTGIAPTKPLTNEELVKVQVAMSQHEGAVSAKTANAPAKTVNQTPPVGASQSPQLAPVTPAQQQQMIGPGATAPQTNNNNSTSVQTNIQNVNVQTQATDANGIARDMNKAFQNNSLINLGLAGNR